MDYKLQNELRDAGYNGGFLLEELIEACGHGFGAMERIVIQGKPIFTAGIYVDRNGDIERGQEGETPTEAVAKLWISMNKK
jgi:hypothetical protein